MNNKKQRLILEYLVSSPDVFAICSSILEPKYFDPELRKAMQFLKIYYEEHNAIPDTDQIEVESDIVIKTRVITRDQFDYCCTEVESFCKQSAMKEAILASVDLLEKDDFGAIETNIKKAVTVSLNKDLGVDFFEEARATLTRLLSVGTTISTGWKDVDDVLFGGIKRKELILFSAGSGGGKSITMQNLGLNLVAQGLNVLYISLELSEELLAERMAFLLSGISKLQMKEKFEEMLYSISEFSTNKTPGKMIFKQMPAGSNVNHLKSFLKEYELRYGHIPDAIITDYLDLMNPTDKVSADNVFEKDKRVAEDLRNLGVEYNLISITASQLNRSSVTADVINHSHIAGGISKINTADTYITIMLSDTLKSAGEIGFSYQKTRNSDGVGKMTYLRWNVKNLQITDKPDHMSSILKPIGSGDIKKPKSKLAAMFDDSDLD